MSQRETGRVSQRETREGESERGTGECVRERHGRVSQREAREGESERGTGG